MSTEAIDIKVSENGSREVRRNIEDIGKGAKSSETAVNSLNRALKGIAVGATLRYLQQTVDSYSNINTTLKQVTTSQVQLNQVLDEVYAISTRTRSGFTDNIESYRRFALATKDLGTTQRDVLQFTEALNSAVLLSGANAQEARAAIIQLSQGLGAGRLQGDELRAVLEQLPTVADVIAKQMGVTRGELKQLGADGKITAKVILDAFKTAAAGLNGSIGAVPITISQSFTLLKNSLVKTIGEFDHAHKISVTIAEGIRTLSRNIDDLAKVLVIATAAFATFYAVAAGSALLAIGAGVLANIGAFIALAKEVKNLSQAFLLLDAALLLNPFGLVLAAVVALGVAIYLFRDKLKPVSDAIGNFAADGILFFAKMADGATGAFNGLLEVVKGIMDKITVLIARAALAVDGFFHKTTYTEQDVRNAVGDEVYNRAGQSAGDLYAKSFADSVKNGIANSDVTKQLAQGLRPQFGPQPNKPTAADELGGAIKGGSSAGLGLPSAQDLKAQETAAKRQQKLLEEIQGPQATYQRSLGDINTLYAAGKINSVEYNEALYQLNKTTAEGGLINKRLQDSLEAIKGPELEFARNAETLQILLDQGRISAEQYADAMDKLKLAVLETDKSFNGGIQRGLLKIKEQMSDTGQLAENVLVNGFNAAEDALSNFVATGKLEFGDLVDSIVKDIARLAIQQFITGPLFAAFGFADGGPVKKYAGGGIISGQGGPRSDSIPAMVSDGEYIVNASATAKFKPILDFINNGGSAPSTGGSQSYKTSGGGGNTFVFAPVISTTVESKGGDDQKSSEAQGENVTKAISGLLDQKFGEYVAQQSRPGGQLNPGGTYS